MSRARPDRVVHRRASSPRPVTRIRRLSTAVRSKAGGRARGGGSLAACHLPASPAPATPPTAPVTRLRNPGELLAALPYLIGFHPRDSLLFVAFGGSSGRRIELTQRVDLPPADDAPAVCGALAANVLRVTPAGVAVVVVGGDPVEAGRVPFGGPPPREVWRRSRRRRWMACGVPVQSRTWAAGTDAGAAWACYDECGCRGAVPGPGHHPVRRHRGRRGALVARPTARS